MRGTILIHCERVHCMSKVIRTDRSRVETYQRCARARFLEYHEAGTGIVSAKRPLPLCVGGSVHEGLAHLLRLGQQAWDSAGGWDGIPVEFLRQVEDGAVVVALADFAQHRGALALDTTELAQQASGQQVPADDLMREQLAASLGLDVNDTALGALQQQPGQGAKEFDDYLWAEQSALVEALVRAYSRRRLRPLLEQYEVLEVEWEGEWLLAQHRPLQMRVETTDPSEPFSQIIGDEPFDLVFMSRPAPHPWHPLRIHAQG